VGEDVEVHASEVGQRFEGLERRQAHRKKVDDGNGGRRWLAEGERRRQHILYVDVADGLAGELRSDATQLGEDAMVPLLGAHSGCFGEQPWREGDWLRVRRDTRPIERQSMESQEQRQASKQRLDSLGGSSSKRQ
jgi:hypothetical protein